MDILKGIDITTAGFILLSTFGAVSAVNFWKKQTTQWNFILSVLFAFLFGFVPADLGNLIANKIKDAIAIAVTLNGAYQFIGGVARKIGQPDPKPPQL